MASVLSSPQAMAAALDAYVRWAVGVEWQDFAPAVHGRAVQVLADDLAAALSALDEPEMRSVRGRALARDAGAQQASLFAPGLPKRTVAESATLNALAMGWNELDEGYRKAVCHAGLYVLPALLAAAEPAGASLREVLRALVLGYETAARFALAWRQPQLLIHPHALVSPVGAAAGLAFLHRLDAEQALAAITGAATLGMVGPFQQALTGVLARNTWAAQAAQAGLNAVEWARCGIGGTAESPHHVYATVLGAQADPEALRPGANGGWAIESGYQKVHACCQYAHSTIEAMQELLARHPQLRGGDGVAAIEVEAHPLAYALDERQPCTTLGAKFSVPHAAASALVHGNGGVEAFDARSLTDARIARLRAATRLLPFPEVRPWPEDRPARVTLVLQQGARLTAECWSARGGPDRPHGEDAVWAKVVALSHASAPAFADVMHRMAAAVAVEADASLLQRSWSQWLAEAFAVSAD